MSDGNDRSQKRQPNSGYNMNPYFYQHYYAAAVPNAAYAGAGMVQGQQPVYAVADPTQPGGYRWVYHPAYVAAHGGMMASAASAQQQQGVPAYYFPYHPSYAAYYQQQQQQPVVHQEQPRVNGSPDSSSSSSSSSLQVPSSQVSQDTSQPMGASSVPEVDDSSSGVGRPPLSRSATANGGIQYTRTMTGASSGVPEPLLLIRKTSQGFSRDQSKWTLSRSASKASLGVANDTDDEELVNLPSSPLMGRKASLSVSPRQCGTEFLPDEPTYTKSRLHLIDAIRLKATGHATFFQHEHLAERYKSLERVMEVEMSMIDTKHVEFVGLLNPVNSKICYLNSVIQILVPISPLMQFMSFCLSHVESEELKWTQAFARAFRMMFNPPIGTHASLLACDGMDLCIEHLGGLGNQQDVGEALCTVLDRLHEELKYDKSTRSAASSCAEVSQDGRSIVYELFRGIKRYGNGSTREIFTTIHLAPVGGTTQCLNDLLALTFGVSQGCQLDYLPPVLCIELSRHLSENQLTTSQMSVPFSGSLQVPKSCCTDEMDVSRNYQLVGVVVRSGVYANSGHFWVAQRRGSKWAWLNDTEVSDCAGISEEDQVDFEENLISKKLDASTNWCVLVYADIDSKISLHP